MHDLKWLRLLGLGSFFGGGMMRAYDSSMSSVRRSVKMKRIRTKKSASLSAAQIAKLMEEGTALRRSFAQRIASMKLVTSDDLKTRMR
jgi:hypothetical protein